MPEPGRNRVLAAFAAVYVIWGSTYLAIRVAVGTIPPFLMAGVRFLIAGALLLAWARLRGAARPTRRQWAGAALIGVLLLTGGNGAVVWSERRVSSGLVALLVAMVPAWTVLIEWVQSRRRPAALVLAGLVVGLTGVGLLVAPWESTAANHIDPAAALALMAGSFSWSLGSVFSRRVGLPPSPSLATAMEMLVGGAGLLAVGTIGGEWRGLAAGTITTGSLLAVLYLIVFGSLIGFSAFVWLLQVSTPARVSTYAFVNPAVAVLLGWAVAGERLTLRIAAAAAVIVLGVVLITAGAARPKAARPAGD